VLFRFKQTAKAGLKIGRFSGQFSGDGLLPHKQRHGDITMPCLWEDAEACTISSNASGTPSSPVRWSSSYPSSRKCRKRAETLCKIQLFFSESLEDKSILEGPASTNCADFCRAVSMDYRAFAPSEHWLDA